jgi:hypothetical protein
MERLPALVIKSPEQGGTYFENTKNIGNGVLRRFSRLEKASGQNEMEHVATNRKRLLQPVLQ